MGGGGAGRARKLQGGSGRGAAAAQRKGGASLRVETGGGGAPRNCQRRGRGRGAVTAGCQSAVQPTKGGHGFGCLELCSLFTREGRPPPRHRRLGQTSVSAMELVWPHESRRPFRPVQYRAPGGTPLENL